MRAISVALALAAGVAIPAMAQTYTLEDFNSSTTFNLSNGGNQINWTVDGVNQLFGQRFFYRDAFMGDEAAVDSLPLTGHQATDTNTFDDSRVDTLSTRYTATSGLEFRISYTLRGGANGSGTGDLAETIRIQNNSLAPISLSFFQYVDFDLGATPGGDFGEVIGGDSVYQYDTSGNMTVNETVVTPAPNHYQLGQYPSIVNLFGDGLVTNLNDFGGPLGPTDVTWAFQWDITLNPGQNFIISKDKLLYIPTPGAAALLGLGGLVATRRRR